MLHIRLRVLWVALCVCTALWMMPVTAQAQESLDNLALPRWVSMAAKKANMRTGPGKRYPIDWVLTKKSLPLEVTREFEHWRLVRDPDGATGWVHRSMLTGARHVMVQADEKLLYANPSEQAPVVARLKNGVTARLRNCQRDWCRVTVEDYSGWLTKKDVWGLYPDEIVE